MHIQIYSKELCPFCDMAAKKAEAMSLNTTSFGEEIESNVTWNKYMLNTDFTREQLLEKFPNARTFPQITIDGEAIGGWQEFKEI